MDLLSQIVARAKANKQRIVLPEAEEERTLCAADRVLADDIANIILIGNPDKVHALVKEKGLKLDAVQAQLRANRDGVDKRFDAIVQLKSIRDQLVKFQSTLDELFPDIPAQR